MKYLEKFILVVFSIIIIIESIAMILYSTEMMNITPILNKMIEYLVSNKIIAITLGAILSVLGLIGMFLKSSDSENIKSGLAIKSEKGTTYIAKDTFDSIVMAIARNYPELKNIKVETIVTEEGIVANVYAMVLPDTVLPTLTEKLQENIKTSVLKQTTVEIKEANVKIRGVYLEPQKK